MHMPPTAHAYEFSCSPSEWPVLRGTKYKILNGYLVPRTLSNGAVGKPNSCGMIEYDDGSFFFIDRTDGRPKLSANANTVRNNYLKPGDISEGDMAEEVNRRNEETMRETNRRNTEASRYRDNNTTNNSSRQRNGGASDTPQPTTRKPDTVHQTSNTEPHNPFIVEDSQAQDSEYQPHNPFIVSPESEDGGKQENTQSNTITPSSQKPHDADTPTAHTQGENEQSESDETDDAETPPLLTIPEEDREMINAEERFGMITNSRTETSAIEDKYEKIGQFTPSIRDYSKEREQARAAAEKQAQAEQRSRNRSRSRSRPRSSGSAFTRKLEARKAKPQTTVSQQPLHLVRQDQQWLVFDRPVTRAQVIQFFWQGRYIPARGELRSRDNSNANIPATHWRINDAPPSASMRILSDMNPEVRTQLGYRKKR
jgi:hypothetical protein